MVLAVPHKNLLRRIIVAAEIFYRLGRDKTLIGAAGLDGHFVGVKCNAQTLWQALAR
jgi:hypothetical protein